MKISKTEPRLVVARVSSADPVPRVRRPRRFQHFAQGTARAVGSPWAFCVALGLIVAWALLGPVFHFSDTWQLVINTSTTIITFLMVFLIQHTQNRDTEGLRLKLDELIRAVDSASNDFIELEDLDDEELAKLHLKFQQLREQSRAQHQTTSSSEPSFRDEAKRPASATLAADKNCS
jgi:low affinity Fe/Cu permease